MKNWKLHLGAAALAVLAFNVSAPSAGAAPAVGMQSLAHVAGASTAGVEKVQYRRRHSHRHWRRHRHYGHRHWGHRRYGHRHWRYRRYGHRHWRGHRHWGHHHHGGFPLGLLAAPLVIGSALGGGCW